MTTKVLTPSGQAKILKTQRKVLDALKTLATTIPPVKLTVTEVCRSAGVTPDTLALVHHNDLKCQVEAAIIEHNASHFGRARKKSNPASDVAVARIRRLEADLAELETRYNGAVLSIRSLALALESAVTELRQAREKIPTSAIELVISGRQK